MARFQRVYQWWSVKLWYIVKLWASVWRWPGLRVCGRCWCICLLGVCLSLMDILSSHSFWKHQPWATPSSLARSFNICLLSRSLYIWQVRSIITQSSHPPPLTFNNMIIFEGVLAFMNNLKKSNARNQLALLGWAIVSLVAVVFQTTMIVSVVFEGLIW